jgi:hypothetical protein
MSSSTQLYINQYNEKNDELIPMNLIMTKTKKAVNELVQESYDKNDIKNYETNPNAPFIRNKAKLENFNYYPEYHEKASISSEVFRADFC